jgi:hypothetical protein
MAPLEQHLSYTTPAVLGDIIAVVPALHIVSYIFPYVGLASSH